MTLGFAPVLSMGLLLALSASAQVVPAAREFERLYQQAEAARATADPDRVRSLFGAATDAFARLDPATPPAAPMLARAGTAAYLAARYPLAARWFAVGIEQAPEADRDFCRQWQVQALVAAGKGDEAMARAALLAWADLDRDRRHLADRLLLQPEPRVVLFHAADRLLRTAKDGSASAALFAGLVRAAAHGDRRAQGHAWADFALTMRCLGRIAEAERAYATALELTPEPTVRNDMGLLLKGTGRPAQARQVLAAAYAQEEPKGDSPAATNLAVLYLRQDRPAGTTTGDLRAVLIQRPDALLARRLLLDQRLPRRVGSGVRRHPHP